MPADSEAVGAPGGGGDVEQEFEIRNDEGFVYKVPRGLYPDAGPSTTQSVAGLPDPKAAGLRRRRRALLRLRAKRLRDLSRWEALASELLLPLPAPQPPAPPQLPQSLPVAAAASSSASVLDELLEQVDIQTELMRKVNQWCDEANAFCDAGQAAIVDSMVTLPFLGGNPMDLVAALSQDKDPALQPGVNSAADEMIKNGVGKKPIVHGLTPILTESRMRKRGTNLSGSMNVAPPTPIESKSFDQWKKASGSKSTAPATPGSIPRRKPSGTTSTASGTPGPTTRRQASTAPGTPGSTMRRKATSTPARAPDIVCSSRPLTRRAAAQKEKQQLIRSLMTGI